MEKYEGLGKCLMNGEAGTWMLATAIEHGFLNDEIEKLLEKYVYSEGLSSIYRVAEFTRGLREIITADWKALVSWDGITVSHQKKNSFYPYTVFVLLVLDRINWQDLAHELIQRQTKLSLPSRPIDLPPEGTPTLLRHAPDTLIIDRRATENGRDDTTHQKWRKGDK